MRPLDLCGVLLLAGSVAMALASGLKPWPLTVSFSLQAPVSQEAPAQTREPSAVPTHLRLLVTRTVPGVTGLAIGDAVTFDRYGIYAPVAGTRACVPLQAGAIRPLEITALGGRMPDVPVARLDLVALGGAGAGAECVPSLPPLLPVHP